MAYRVLIVDDETAIREAIRMTLEYEGYKIEEARSGQEGIDKATKVDYDAILLDIKMPVLDGIEVLENLKLQKVTSPVVMATAVCTTRCNSRRLPGHRCAKSMSAACRLKPTIGLC